MVTIQCLAPERQQLMLLMQLRMMPAMIRCTAAPGDDMLYGGIGDDTLNGGPGDDDLTGGTGDDTFVFTQDGLGSDVILDFAAGAADANGPPATMDGSGDKIDLSAFNIDDSDLAGLLSDRAGNVIVNLEAYGGGRITIDGCE